MRKEYDFNKSKKKRLSINSPKLSVLFLALLFTSSAFCGTDYYPTKLQDEIELSTPKKLRFDEILLSRGFKRAENLPYSHSLLVLRDGKLVAEQYFHGYGPQSANNLKSVSKSVTSVLIGIALDKKILKSIDEPVQNFFPSVFKELKDPKKSKITLRHLLTMSAGLDANDDNPEFESSSQLDKAKYTFTRPLISEPGTLFSYSSAYADALSRLLTETSGIPTRDFAQKYLFDPIGVKVLGWSRDGLGYYLGESEIFLTSRDMIKFGLLMLNKGMSKNKKVISEQWVSNSTSAKIKASEGNGQYGYLWWMKPDQKIPFFYAWGYGGQYIYVIPSKKMVIVMTNDFTHRRPQAEIRDLIEQNIIAAAKD